MADADSEKYGIGDLLFYPIATPGRGSMLTAAGISAGIGALGGGLLHLRDRFTGEILPEKGGFRRKVLGGAAIGAGLSLGSNLLGRYTLQDGKIKPRDGWTETAEGMRYKTRPTNREIMDTINKQASWERSFSTSALKKKVAMSMISDMEMRRMIMDQSAIPFGVKRVMFQEVAHLTEGNGRAVSLNQILNFGVGGVAGMVAAKAMGFGPIATGVAATVGALGIGGALTPGRDEHYAQGFKIY